MLKQFLAGEVAIVTGASRGLGAASASWLASAGAATVLVARSEAELQVVAENLRRAGHKATPVAANIADAESVAALFDFCWKQFGGVDLLVNIAGTIDGIGRNGWELDASEWQTLVETNITGPFLLCRGALRTMVEAGKGRILMLTSSSAERPTPQASAYGASKAAVNQLVRAIAEELADTGVTVNAFNPGPVQSPTLERVRTNLEAGPWRRYWGGATRSPEEAARLILWLCSPAAAGINGEIVVWNDPAVRAAQTRFEKEAGLI